MGAIAGHALTDGNANDAAQAPALPGQPESTVASVIAHGVHDGKPTGTAAAARQPDPVPDVVVPPRASAAPGTADLAKHSPRDRHVHLIAECRRVARQKATGHGRRALVEAAAGRHKHRTGPKLGTRTLPGQHGEVALAVHALSRMIRAAKPVSVRAA